MACIVFCEKRIRSAGIVKSSNTANTMNDDIVVYTVGNVRSLKLITGFIAELQIVILMQNALILWQGHYAGMGPAEIIFEYSSSWVIKND